MRIAVIPARGGSKRIPRKNIKSFCGMPIICWSISAALESRCFDQVIVTTDDQEIAGIAREHGATTPFVRPPELSDDYTGTIPVVAHAVEWIEDNIGTLVSVCCIYPAAPFVTAEVLRHGLGVLEQSRADYAFPVVAYPSPIQRAFRLTPTSRVKMFDERNYKARSQDLEQAYHDAGQFYWGRTDAWRARQPLFNDHSAAFVIDRERAQDIDTVEDWRFAELLFQLLQKDKCEQT
jgi:pseudaminic acid cytidylyltransferase